MFLFESDRYNQHTCDSMDITAYDEAKQKWWIDL